MKLESCQKSRKSLHDFFAVTNFFGTSIVKIVPILSPLPRGASTEKSFVRILLIARKVFSLTR